VRSWQHLREWTKEPGAEAEDTAGGAVVEGDVVNALLAAAGDGVAAGHPIGGAAGGEEEAEVADRDRQVEVGIGRGGGSDTGGELAPLRAGKEDGGIGVAGAVGLDNDLREGDVVLFGIDVRDGVVAERVHVGFGFGFESLARA